MEPHQYITLRHLLQMRPGLYWNEGYESSPLKSSVLAMLYTAGRKDMASFTAQQPMRYRPGTFWYYSSGNSNLLMAILRNAVTPQHYVRFIWKELFGKIGMKNVVWERDNSGTFVGSSYLYAPPRQLAKFGYLYLNDGIWKQERILPKGWVRFSSTVSPADPVGHYGAHWWLNAGRPSKGISKRWSHAPTDTICASGHWGQYIFVIPSLDLVIVRTGDDRDHSFNRDRLLELIIASISKTTQKIKSQPKPVGAKK